MSTMITHQGGLVGDQVPDELIELKERLQLNRPTSGRISSPWSKMRWSTRGFEAGR